MSYNSNAGRFLFFFYVKVQEIQMDEFDSAPSSIQNSPLGIRKLRRLPGDKLHFWEYY